MFRSLLIASFLFTFLTTSFSQDDNVIPGQLLIQFNRQLDVVEFQNEFQDIELQNVQQLSRRMNIWLFSYNTNLVSVDDVLLPIRQNRNVKTVQFNHTLTLRSDVKYFENGDSYSSNSLLATIPSDTRFNEQWALNNTGQSGGTPDADIDAPEAWDIETGGLTKLGDTIVVAIIDGGCQLNHPDLSYWYNWEEIPNNGMDDDGNGYIDDFRGWNAYGNNGTVPSSSHGTHVSGTAGATGNNGIGVSGVNWNVKVMPIAGSSSSEATVVAAYSYVHEMRSRYNETNGLHGAFIVSTNASFGVDYGQPSNYPLWCAIYDSLGVQGVLSCGATANLNINIDVNGDVPTACPSPYMISVTNTTRTDQKNSGAAYGLNTIDLGSPGTSILSTDLNGTYTLKTGTSMATPHVTGAIGLMFAAADSNFMVQYKSDLPNYTLMVRDILFDATDSIPALQGITVTGGRLNIFNGVQAISNYTIPVELVSFNAEIVNDVVTLNWITATETNNNGFSVLRKKDFESDWTEAAFINGNGTSTEINYYSFTDKVKDAGKYQYRLKQVDLDGTFELSSIVEVEFFGPDKFSLSQNFPNPFNPNTKIKFTIPSLVTLSEVEGSFVTLKVYDVLGNEITTLVNEEKPAGTYEIEFNTNSHSRRGGNLTSGVYLYKLSAGSFVETKKMILLK